jgi:ribose-phosphate pyrophosphokinase
VTAVSAHVEDRHVIIYDDMIRTGGSLISAAAAYKDAGAKEIDVVTTHGLFTGDALDKIQATGLIRHIHSSDSHPGARAEKKGFLTVHSTAPLFVKALTNRP